MTEVLTNIILVMAVGSGTAILLGCLLANTGGLSSRRDVERFWAASDGSRTRMSVGPNPILMMGLWLVAICVATTLLMQVVMSWAP